MGPEEPPAEQDRLELSQRSHVLEPPAASDAGGGVVARGLPEVDVVGAEAGGPWKPYLAILNR